MSTDLGVAIVANIVGPVVLLVMGRLMSRRIERVEQATAETRDQVKNSHTKNLRDDLDDKFMSLQRGVDTAVERSTAAARDASRAIERLDTHGREIKALKHRLDAHLDDI